MTTDMAKELAWLDYNADEVQRHKKLVIADLNKYIKKIPGAD
jgi:hypothetical protein